MVATTAECGERKSLDHFLVRDDIVGACGHTRSMPRIRNACLKEMVSRRERMVMRACLSPACTSAVFAQRACALLT
jgi:hypothetical protein